MFGQVQKCRYIIHPKLAYRHKLINEEMPNFNYEPETTLECSEYKIVWDHSVITDKHTPANRLDIILINKTDK
jgi:hypothetical protein